MNSPTKARTSRNNASIGPNTTALRNQNDVPVLHSVISDRLYIYQAVDILPESDRFKRFVPDESIKYFPLCDDFGPMNAASVIQFVSQLDSELEEHSECILFYCVDDGQRSLTRSSCLEPTESLLLSPSSPERRWKKRGTRGGGERGAEGDKEDTR